VQAEEGLAAKVARLEAEVEALKAAVARLSGQS
jgi:hypothetical protein